MTAAPNSTGAILVAGASAVSTFTITWRWNGVYSLCAMIVFAGLCRVMIEA